MAANDIGLGGYLEPFRGQQQLNEALRGVYQRQLDGASPIEHAASAYERARKARAHAEESAAKLEELKKAEGEALATLRGLVP